MLTGEIRSQIDRIWDAFWSGGISNPLEVIEQITYLLFLKRLDDLHTLEENKANRDKEADGAANLPRRQGQPRSAPYEDYRWSRFKNFAPAEMYRPWSASTSFRSCARSAAMASTYAHHMKDARFTIPTPALLAKVVDMIDNVPMEDRDTKGDLYEYMLGKIASAGQNGQFRTPRHIIRLMVEMVGAEAEGRHLRSGLRHLRVSGRSGRIPARATSRSAARRQAQRKHFHHELFHGFDFDNTMLRIGSMNMLLHGVENPDMRYRDSLAQDHAGEEEKYTLVLANPPFAGSLDYENCRQGPASRSSRRRRPSCCFWRCSCGCSSRAAGRRSSCRTACCSARATRTRRCGRCWSRIRSSTP